MLTKQPRQPIVKRITAPQFVRLQDGDMLDVPFPARITFRKRGAHVQELLDDNPRPNLRPTGNAQ